MGKILVGSNFNYKNLIINSGFDIWQRGEDVTGQDAYLGVDRFRIWQDTDGDAFDIRNVKSNDSFINVSRYEISNTDSNATYNNFGVTQRVEPLIYVPHIGEKLTLSFWVKSNKTNVKINIKHNYTDSDGNEQEEILYSADLTIVGDSWNKIEQAFVLDSAALQDTSNTTNWIELFAIEVDGVANGDYLELKEVQAEKGNIATSFEVLPYDVQLQRCMRYYEKSYNINDNPGTITFEGSIGNDTSGTNNTNILFRVVKRNTPTLQLYSPKSGDAGVIYYTNRISDNDPSGDISFSLYYISCNGFHIEASPGDNYYILLHFTADAEL